MNSCKHVCLVGSLLWLAAAGLLHAQNETSSQPGSPDTTAKTAPANPDAQQVEEVTQPISVALLGVYNKGEEVKEMAPKIGALLMAEMSTKDTIQLVEREEIDKIISELEINLSGMIDPKTANQIGRMTGAHVLVTAATFQVDGTLYVVAKVIGVETTRVFGVTVKGPLERQLDLLTSKLAENIAETISKRQKDLLAPKKSEEDRLAALKKKLGDDRLPVLSISITEQHVGKALANPTAEVEFVRICRELGFTVVDSATLRSTKAELSISGQASSEFAMQKQNLIGVRARVEVQVKSVDGKVLVADRQTLSKVALTERIAGKVALEDATLELAERVIPQIMEQWKKR